MHRFNGYAQGQFVLLIIVGIMSCTPDLPPDVAAEYRILPETVDYNIDVKPVLSDKCFICHGPDPARRKAGLRLDMDSSAFAALPENPGKVAIDPGNLRNSEIYNRILNIDPELRMPPPEGHLTLSAKEKAVLIKWIKAGAEYKPHWAFIVPEETRIPAVNDERWVTNPIDNFVLAKLEAEGIKSSRPAEKELLLRRVSLDLTGLPPSPKELDEFLKDDSPAAYEKQVDRMLASPHFGEQMAVGWLDVARFTEMR